MAFLETPPGTVRRANATHGLLYTDATDLTVPGAVEITDQAPVVVKHTVQNFQMRHLAFL